MYLYIYIYMETYISVEYEGLYVREYACMDAYMHVCAYVQIDRYASSNPRLAPVETP